jgi:hypothetical protein
LRSLIYSLIFLVSAGITLTALRVISPDILIGVNVAVLGLFIIFAVAGATAAKKTIRPPVQLVGITMESIPAGTLIMVDVSGKVTVASRIPDPLKEAGIDEQTQ